LDTLGEGAAFFKSESENVIVIAGVGRDCFSAGLVEFKLGRFELFLPVFLVVFVVDKSEDFTDAYYGVLLKNELFVGVWLDGIVGRGWNNLVNNQVYAVQVYLYLKDKSFILIQQVNQQSLMRKWKKMEIDEEMKKSSYIQSINFIS